MSDFKYMNDGGGLLRSIETQAEKMAVAEDGLEKGYAHLGLMLLEVSEMSYWRVHYETFKDYLKSVSMKSKKTPGQLQQYFLTVRDLIDNFTADQLETMGITKAIKLRKAKDYALVLPQAIINSALDSEQSAAELQKVISVALKMPEEEGDYLDLEFEFMVTPEQKAFAEQVIDVAMHTEPLTKSTISKSAQMWNVFEKLGMEFLGAHSGDGN
jgi:hypothetical protein